MTRPAISYDTTIRNDTTVLRRRANGTVAGSDVYSTAVERRVCVKPASIKTSPGPGGAYQTPTPYNYIWGRFKSSSSYAVVVNKPWVESLLGFKTYEWQGPPLNNLGFNISSLLPIPNSIENRLLIAALNKLRNSKFNLGIFIAEAREAQEMLINTSKSIAGGVKRFQEKYPKEWDLVKKTEVGFLRGRKRYAKAIPSGWLELQYGWNPLMSDVAAACSVLDGPNVKPPLIAIDVKRKVIDSTLVTQGWVPGFGSSETTVQAKSDCKVKLCYRLRNFKLASLSSLGLTNPAEIIWEKVPYSFVVDWFLPVGNWLSALGGDFGYDFVNGSYSRFTRFEVLGSVDKPIPANERESAAGGGFTGSAVRFNRSVYSGTPWPGLYFKSPISPGHIANALSLLTQVFRR